jgi:hypothetical protein
MNPAEGKMNQERNCKAILRSPTGHQAWRRRRAARLFDPVSLDPIAKIDSEKNQKKKTGGYPISSSYPASV